MWLPEVVVRLKIKALKEKRMYVKDDRSPAGPF